LKRRRLFIGIERMAGILRGKKELALIIDGLNEIIGD